MIELLLACVLSSSPLAITGNESGLWFIGDVAPNKSSFTARAKDLDFDLCQQYGENEYVVVVPFTVKSPVIVAFLLTVKSLATVRSPSGANVKIVFKVPPVSVPDHVVLCPLTWFLKCQPPFAVGYDEIT